VHYSLLVWVHLLLLFINSRQTNQFLLFLLPECSFLSKCSLSQCIDFRMLQALLIRTQVLSFSHCIPTRILYFFSSQFYETNSFLVLLKRPASMEQGISLSIGKLCYHFRFHQWQRLLCSNSHGFGMICFGL